MQYSSGDLYGADYHQFCGIWRDMERDGGGRNRRLSRRIRESWQPGADAFHVFQSAVCGDACAVDSGYCKNQQSEIQDHRSGAVCDFLKTGLLRLESTCAQEKNDVSDHLYHRLQWSDRGIFFLFVL